MAKEKELSFEALALMNIIVTKHLIRAVLLSGNLSKPQMQAVFDAAKEELQRTTLSIGVTEADEMLAFIWGDYVAPFVDPKTN